MISHGQVSGIRDRVSWKSHPIEKPITTHSDGLLEILKGPHGRGHIPGQWGMAGWSFAVRRMKHSGKERHLKYRES